MTTRMKLGGAMTLKAAGIVVFSSLVGLGGCGRGFEIKTPPSFIELRNQEPTYGYRATTPEGVVISVRKQEAKDRSDLAFWERAITLQMRDTLGYALLSSNEMSTTRGKKGKQLRFGHDENGKPYEYWVTLFTGDDWLYVLEAGGPADLMHESEALIQWHIGTLKD